MAGVKHRGRNPAHWRWGDTTAPWVQNSQSGSWERPTLINRRIIFRKCYVFPGFPNCEVYFRKIATRDGQDFKSIELERISFIWIPSFTLCWSWHCLHTQTGQVLTKGIRVCFWHGLACTVWDKFYNTWERLVAVLMLFDLFLVFWTVAKMQRKSPAGLS